MMLAGPLSEYSIVLEQQSCLSHISGNIDGGIYIDKDLAEAHFQCNS
jgi:hypothetical protein